jgi:hypothetical protein
MKYDVIVISDLEAIGAARQIAAGLADYEVLLFDPMLADPAMASGLLNVRLITEVGDRSYVSLDIDAHAAALALETELDAAQRNETGISILGWQHLNLYYLFITLQWYASLWETVGHQFAGRTAHVLINDNPAEYYFNSFVPSVLLVSFFQRQGMRFKAYEYGARGRPVYVVPDLGGQAPNGGADCLLTHVPTCFYDIEYFRDEIRASGKTVINFKSKFWDVPIAEGQQIGLVDMENALADLSLGEQQQIVKFTRQVEHGLRVHLTPHIKLPLYCDRQIEHIVQLFRGQLLTYLRLQRYFHPLSPGELILAEHDAGFTGPMLTFAVQRALPVIILPHSRASDDLTFSAEGVLVLTHPMQGQPVRDLHGRLVAQRLISIPERFSATNATGRGLQTISLLLNAQSLGGVLHVPTVPYLDGIKRLATWCRDHRVRLKIRCRPGYPIFGLLKVAVGVDPDTLAPSLHETIEEHARDCDLCVMYDMPTMGSLVFLRNSIPVLNPVVTTPPGGFLANAHPSVITTESLDATFQRLEAFASDPLALDIFRMAQFHAYLSLFQDARPLRTFIGVRAKRDATSQNDDQAIVDPAVSRSCFHSAVRQSSSSSMS